MVSPFSGITANSLFDVTPYAVALSERILKEDDSFTLPRKFKIAFADNSADSGYALSTDLGFIATIKEGKPGFAVYAGGGLGRKPVPMAAVSYSEIEISLASFAPLHSSSAYETLMAILDDENISSPYPRISPLVLNP